MKSVYPINKLIVELQAVDRLSRGHFLAHLGYKNINKAIRMLDHFPTGDSSVYRLVDRLIKSYPDYKAAILRALEDTQRKLKEEEFLEEARREREARENFRPYIYIETERKVPSPIFVAAIIGRKAKFIDFKIPLPTLSDAQLTVKEHSQRNGGISIPFGAITGYRYVDSFDSSIRLDLYGAITEHNARKFAAPEGASLMLKGRKISQKELEALKLSLDIEKLT